MGACALGCVDGGASGDPEVDVGFDGASGDRGLDGGPVDIGDGPIDAGSADRALDAAPMPDLAPLDMEVDPLLLPCRIRESPRPPDALRVAGCRVVREGEAAVLPRAVVVSGDSLTRPAATPLHQPPMYADLAAAGVDVIWLLVLWEGIEPMRGTYNGAYLGRVCEQARWAAGAGLDVVLALSQDRFGSALGGHGMPPWITPEGLEPVPVADDGSHPSLAAAWGSLWDGEGPDLLVAAWIRLLDTCALDEAHGIEGIQPLIAPRGSDEALAIYSELSAAVEAEAEARLGPLLVFESPLRDGESLAFRQRPGADRVLAVSGWGPGLWPGAVERWPMGWRSAAREGATAAGHPAWVVGVGGETPAGMAAAQARVEADGMVGVVWQDGFGTPYGLRDEDGAPAALWDPALRRPRPMLVAGRPLSWSSDEDGFTLRWLADGSAQGLSRVDMAGRIPGEPVFAGVDGVEWFTDYDPATGLLAVFVEGAPGVVEMSVPFVGP